MAAVARCIGIALLAASASAVPVMSNANQQLIIAADAQLKAGALDMISVDLLNSEMASRAAVTFGHEVDVSISDTHRRLQSGTTALRVKYTVACGTSCDAVTAALTDPAVRATHAAALVSAITATASAAGFANAVVSTAEEIASTMTAPQTVTITLPVTCETAVDGAGMDTDCFGHVMWAINTGIVDHPDWYPLLTPANTFEDFQCHLFHLEGVDHCDYLPCDYNCLVEPPAPAPAPAAFTYLGCFRDNEGGRDLTGTGSQNAGGSTAIENANNCVALCAGFQYFGLQWVNECFCDNSYNNGNGNNGNQGDCPNGECPITDCDADGAIDADGTADLCANGQGNCGNRNAVYAIGGPTFTATASVAVLQFTSDGSVTRTPGPLEAVFSCAAPAPAPGPDACVAPITLTDADTGSAQNTAMDYDMGHGNAEDCQWIMTCADAAESPIVIFHTFNTETNFDYVNIYDGADTAAPRIGRFHGTDLPAATALTSNVGVLQFTSDGSVTQDGFHASFTCAVNTGPPPPPDPCVTPIVYDGAHDPTLQTGFTMMLDMDAGHANGQNCRWSVVCPAGQLASLTFDTFQTENNFDFVNIYDGATDDVATRIGRYHGTTAPSITATNTTMLVEFTSDGSVTRDGFLGSFSCNGPPCGPQGQQADAASNQAIPGNYVVADGETFTYVQGTDHMRNCVWTMGCDAMHTGMVGTVTFNSFVSEGNWDFLNVWSDASLVSHIWGPAANNGGVDNTGDLGRFSGTGLAADTAISGVGAVQYISDWSYVQPGAGFSATLVCTTPPGTPPGCGASGDAGDNTAARDTVTTTVACGESFGLAADTVGNQQNCVWEMAATTGAVTITNMVTEGGWDFLNLWSDATLVVNTYGPAGSNGGVDNTGDLGRFDGTTGPAAPVAGVAAVQYISDWSYVQPGTGFVGTLSC